MKKIYIILLIILIVFGLVAGYTKYFSSKRVKPGFKRIELRGQIFKIEIADTDQLRGRGLSGRENLAYDEGMLFTFDKRGIYPFWMKDMKFSIDIIWIREDTVVDITENIPVPVTSNEVKLPTYSSSLPVDKVLEVNSGIVEKLGVEVGDKLKITNLL